MAKCDDERYTLYLSLLWLCWFSIWSNDGSMCIRFLWNPLLFILNSKRARQNKKQSKKSNFASFTSVFKFSVDLEVEFSAFAVQNDVYIYSFSVVDHACSFITDIENFTIQLQIAKTKTNLIQINCAVCFYFRRIGSFFFVLLIQKCKVQCFFTKRVLKIHHIVQREITAHTITKGNKCKRKPPRG